MRSTSATESQASPSRMITRDSPSPRHPKHRSRSPHRRSSRRSRSRSPHRHYTPSRTPPRAYKRRRRTPSLSPSRSPSRYRTPSYHRYRRRRTRTRSPSPRRRSYTPSSYTSSSYYSSSSRSRSRSRSRSPSPSPSASPSASPSPSYTRTVFVSQISPRAREADLAAFFTRVARVRRVRLVADRNGRHKGAAYVEFFDTRDVHAALGMAGRQLLGVPVAVRRGEDGAQQQTSVGWSQRRPRSPLPRPQLVSIDELRRLLNPHNLPVTPVKHGPTRIYVGSISFNIGEADLKRIFSPFGSIVSMAMPRDTMGKLRGYAFVEYADSESAKKALTIDGLVIDERSLKVALAGQAEDGASGSVPLPGDAGKTHVPLPGPAAAERVPLPGPTAAERVPLPLVGDVPGELDEGKDGGVSMNAQRRVMLMQQLSRGETLGAKLEGDLNKLSTTEVSSRSLILSNMFDPATEPEEFEKELAEDVRDECMAKYGTVTHLHVEGRSHGIVYIRFLNPGIAEKARVALHGRWFGGKKINAGYVRDTDYDKRFPKAK